MPTPTYTPLANITLGSSATSVSFSSISGIYRDLICVVEGIAATGSGGTNIYARMNSDTGSNYSSVYMSGNGSTTASGSGTTTGIQLSVNAFFAEANRVSYQLSVMDYSATDKHKSTLSRANNPGAGVQALAGRWANTAAVTTLQILTLDGSSMAAGTTMALYGVAA